MQAKRGKDPEKYPEPEPNEFRVYLLREKRDGPCSYVGHTGQLPEERLMQHNETNVRGQGAVETRGTQWKICRVYKGFTSRENTTSSEESINANEVECWQQRIPVIKSIWSLDKWQWVKEDMSYTDDDI